MFSFQTDAKASQRTRKLYIAGNVDFDRFMRRNALFWPLVISPVSARGRQGIPGYAAPKIGLKRDFDSIFFFSLTGRVSWGTTRLDLAGKGAFLNGILLLIRPLATGQTCFDGDRKSFQAIKGAR